MADNKTIISGQFVDIKARKIYGADISIDNGSIQSIKKTSSRKGSFILPGFVDAHIHIESSMLVPSEFARLALPFGTLCTVSDPHEIANVLGIDGVYYMLDDAEDIPLEILFGAPSCVPSCAFETNGATLDAHIVSKLLSDHRIGYLSEVMNFPGVINRNPELMQMISTAQKRKKPIDGHAPGLRGIDLEKYVSVGISTDHECFTYEEALEKLKLGVKVIIREGSAAKNYQALAPLISLYPDKLFFCSDDKHPDDLLKGHINQLVARAIKDKFDLFDVLQIACINPRKHYGLRSGTLQIGDQADFITVRDLESFNVENVFVNGKLEAQNGKALFPSKDIKISNQFQAKKINIADLNVRALSESIHVIHAMDSQLVTSAMTVPALIRDGHVIADTKNDILKIVVINRYRPSQPAIGFVHGFGLKAGAIASSVAHDAHNIIAIGVSDEAICTVVNKVIDQKGGIAACLHSFVLGLELPVAGIMSDKSGVEVAKQYSLIDLFARTDLKSPLRAPFMSLSFMALPVIPSLKMTDKGLFDGDKFEWTTLFC